MLVVDVIESEINCKQQVESHRSDSHYWSRRRAWWRTHKAETGTDWAGIQRSLVEAAAYLAASRLSPEAIVAEQPEPNADSRGRCDDLSTFASACRKADAERRNPRPRASRDSLPTTSTREAVDWLLKFGDEQRLEKFIEGRPIAEIARIYDYTGIKLNGSHS